MDRDEIETILQKANDLLEAGQAAETLACLAPLEDHLVEADDRIEFASLKAWALTEMGQHDEAVELLDPLAEEFPDSARVLATLGVSLSNAGDLEDAADVLERAIELDDSNGAAVANLGVVYERLRDYRKAMQMYDKAMDQGADVDWLLQRKAAVQSELGDVKAAKSSLRRYLSLAPEDVQEWISLATLHSDDDEFERANQCYREAEQIAPDSIALRLNWGVTAVRAGDLTAARQQLAYLERLDPNSSRPLLLRAFILEESRNYDEALEMYDRALAIVRPEDHDELVYALEMSMDFAARRSLRERCDSLFAQAYASNACSVELCEAYRESIGEKIANAKWFSVVIEADYRAGLSEVPERDHPPDTPYTRYERNFQVIAADPDDATTRLLALLKKTGERRASVREFVGEEPIDDTHAGIYEIERDSLVFAVDARAK